MDLAVYLTPAIRAGVANPGFADLVAAVAEGMGQRPDSVRSTPDGLFLHTSDGFLFVFLEDPAEVSLAAVDRLLAEPAGRLGKLVLLTPGRLPLALAQVATRGRASLIEHERFRELLRGLDLGAFLGEEPRGPHDLPGARLLPSARHLDAVVARARVWLDWGVPALALRFYRQALAQKPGFAPARTGVARSLAALGLLDEARVAFEEVRREHPADVEARLGLAGLDALAGLHEEERRAYREILEEVPDRDDVRAQLIAAEIDAGDWTGARSQLETMLRKTPENPRLRFLHGVTLSRTGADPAGERERERARELGLTLDEERSLAGHVGLPEPPPRAAPGPRPIEETPTESPVQPPAPKRRPRAATRRPARAKKSAPRPAARRTGRKH
jgi:tetratricopeptide (TPR) repeat protein